MNLKPLNKFLSFLFLVEQLDSKGHVEISCLSLEQWFEQFIHLIYNMNLFNRYQFNKINSFEKNFCETKLDIKFSKDFVFKPFNLFSIF